MRSAMIPISYSCVGFVEFELSWEVDPRVAFLLVRHRLGSPLGQVQLHLVLSQVQCGIEPQFLGFSYHKWSSLDGELNTEARLAFSPVLKSVRGLVVSGADVLVVCLLKN